MKAEWTADVPQRSDKHIDVRGPLYLAVDYDDVNRAAVDVLLPHLIATLNAAWTPPYAYVCRNDDCEEYGQYTLEPLDFCPECNKPLPCEPVTESA